MDSASFTFSTCLLQPRMKVRHGIFRNVMSRGKLINLINVVVGGVTESNTTEQQKGRKGKIMLS